MGQVRGVASDGRNAKAGVPLRGRTFKRIMFASEAPLSVDLPRVDVIAAYTSMQVNSRNSLLVLVSGLELSRTLVLAISDHQVLD